jgi:transcriptional regulator with PAS, ATPase and Fis domain
LLRVLQEGAFERVGESIPRKTNVRVIAATNIEIEKALNTGKLREDLFYRLNVIPVVIPSLRERKEDIPYLVKYFIEDFAKVYRKEINDITNFALDILINYNWPGNVRELENVIEYAVVRTKEMQIITKESLPSSLGHLPITKSIDQKVYKKESAAEIVQLLEKHHWNKTRVAKELGIGRTTLWRMLKDLPEKE